MAKRPFLLERKVEEVARHPNDYTVIVTVYKVPHPDPQKAIDLIANLVLKNFSDELEKAEAKQVTCA